MTFNQIMDCLPMIYSELDDDSRINFVCCSKIIHNKLQNIHFPYIFEVRINDMCEYHTIKYIQHKPIREYLTDNRTIFTNHNKIITITKSYFKIQYNTSHFRPEITFKVFNKNHNISQIINSLNGVPLLNNKTIIQISVHQNFKVLLYKLITNLSLNKLKINIWGNGLDIIKLRGFIFWKYSQKN